MVVFFMTEMLIRGLTYDGSLSCPQESVHVTLLSHFLLLPHSAAFKKARLRLQCWMRLSDASVFVLLSYRV